MLSWQWNMFLLPVLILMPAMRNTFLDPHGKKFLVKVLIFSLVSFYFFILVVFIATVKFLIIFILVALQPFVFISVWPQSSFSKLSITSPTSQLILQLFCHFTYITAHSPTLPLLHLHHTSPMPQFILQPFFRFSYATSSSLNSPGEPPMNKLFINFTVKSFFIQTQLRLAHPQFHNWTLFQRFQICHFHLEETWTNIQT